MAIYRGDGGAGVANPTYETAVIADQTGNSGKYLTTDGSNTSWVVVAGTGTVTSASVVSANGFAGTVANATTTPAITLTTSITGVLKGNGTAISAATSGTDYAPATSGTSILYGNGSGGFSNVTVGSGLTFSAGTLSASGGGGSMVYPGAGIPNSTGTAWDTSYTTTGTGTVVALATSPSFTTPILGTPTSGTLTNCTGYTYANLAGAVPTWNQNTTGTASNVTGTVAIANGGTGQTTAAAAYNALNPMTTVGDIIYENTGPTAARLPIGTNGQVLTVVSGLPAWAAAGAGSMIYPGAGIAVSTGSAWGTSLTAPTGTIVGTTDTQTLTNKTLTSPTMIGTLIEDVFTITDAAGFAIDPDNGSIQTITLGANRTPTVANFAAGEAVTLMINDGTAYTITWTTIGVVWVGGTAPTLATTGFTVIELWRVGSTYYGALVGNVA